MQTIAPSMRAVQQVLESPLTFRALPRVKHLLGRTLLNVCDAVPSVKPLVRPLGLRTHKQWCADRVYRVQTPDRKSFKIAGANYLAFELFWKGCGYYEPITALLTQELLRPGHTFLDVGANLGFYSLLVSTRDPRIEIVAFEPNPRNYAALENNARLNGFTNITCVPAAVSDRSGSAALYLCKSDMSASLRSDFEAECTERIEVPTTTLDAYLGARGPMGPLVIKVDVEGHEAAFFRGAAETIASAKPDIITEVTLSYDSSVVAFFKEHGYHFYQITDRGLLEAKSVGPVVRGNFVFLNYLLSLRPPKEAARLFARIAPAVSKIDLRRTSKCLTPEALAKFTARAGSMPPSPCPAEEEATALAGV